MSEKKNEHNKNHFSAKLKINNNRTNRPRQSVLNSYTGDLHKAFWIQRDFFLLLSLICTPAAAPYGKSRLVHNTNHQFLKTVLQHKCDIFNTWLLLKSL